MAKAEDVVLAGPSAAHRSGAAAPVSSREMCGKRLYHSVQCAAGNRGGIATHRPHPGLQ